MASDYLLEQEAKGFCDVRCFESHKHKTMNEMLKQVEPLAQEAIRLIEDGE